MVHVKILNCPAIRNKISVKAPFLTKNTHKLGVCTGRLAVHTVIRAHNARNTRIYQLFKSVKICFVQILVRTLRVKFVTEIFWSAVYSEMLGACRGKHIFAVTL